MTVRRSASARRCAGYVLTVTVIVLMSLVLVGLVVGLAALRDRLVANAGRNLIEDSSSPARALGKPVGFGICEEPLLLCRDPANGLLAMVGVRPDRFTSRNQVFYAGTGCTGDAYLAPPAVPPTSPPELPVGYLNGALDVDSTPARVVYGVGAPEGFDAGTMTPTGPGRLYRSDAASVAGTAVLSVWTSLVPDCAVRDGSAPPPSELAFYSFTGDSPAPTTVDPAATASDVTPVVVAAGGAEIGSTGQCDCTSQIACICADDTEPPPANSYLELTLSCVSGASVDPASLSIRGRFVNALRAGSVHVLASDDGFASSTAAANSPQPIVDQDFTTVYTFDLSNLAPATSWTFRLHPEDTIANGFDFTARLDDLRVSGGCGAGSVAVGGGICTDISEALTLSPAEEVLVDPGDPASANLLELFTPPFAIPPSLLTPVDATPEGPGTDSGGGQVGPQEPTAEGPPNAGS